MNDRDLMIRYRTALESIVTLYSHGRPSASELSCIARMALK